MDIDYYACISGMRKVNSGMKMLFALGALILMLILNDIYVSVFTVVTMGLITVFVGKVPEKIYFKFMRVPFVFMVISCFMIGTEFSLNSCGDVNIHIVFFYMCFTKSSVWKGIVLFFKAAAGMSCIYMLAFSTQLSEIIRVMRKLYVPAVVCELMNMIYRYIFILTDTACKMQMAAKARLGTDGFKKRCRSIGGIGGNLFIIALKKADTYYDALLSRGYKGELKFLNEENDVRLWQVTVCIGYFIMLILISFTGKA